MRSQLIRIRARPQGARRQESSLPRWLTLMNQPKDSTTRKFFADTYWVRSLMPVDALDNRRILLRMNDGPFVREGLFRLDVRQHHVFPDIQLIYAVHDHWDGFRGTTTRISFDQRRANQIRSAESSPDYEFVASFDLGQPLKRIAELDERVDRHLEEALQAIQVLIQDPNERAA
jgi:hypothetical protein